MSRSPCPSASATTFESSWAKVRRWTGIVLTAGLASGVPALLGLNTIISFRDSGSDWRQPGAHQLYGLVSFFLVSWVCFSILFAHARTWRVIPLVVGGQLAANTALVISYAYYTRDVSDCQYLRGFPACATPALEMDLIFCLVYDLLVIGLMRGYLFLRGFFFRDSASNRA